MLSDRGILPREHPGVLAQVQVQEGAGVFIAGAQSLRERHHACEKDRQRPTREGANEKKQKKPKRDERKSVTYEKTGDTLKTFCIFTLFIAHLGAAGISGVLGGSAI